MKWSTGQDISVEHHFIFYSWVRAREREKKTHSATHRFVCILPATNPMRVNTAWWIVVATCALLDIVSQEERKQRWKWKDCSKLFLFFFALAHPNHGDGDDDEYMSEGRRVGDDVSLPLYYFLLPRHTTSPSTYSHPFIFIWQIMDVIIVNTFTSPNLYFVWQTSNACLCVCVSAQNALKYLTLQIFSRW